MKVLSYNLPFFLAVSGIEDGRTLSQLIAALWLINVSRKRKIFELWNLFPFYHINADVLFLSKAEWREELDDIKAAGGNIQHGTYLHGGFYICHVSEIRVHDVVLLSKSDHEAF